ncbi:YmdB family metallophosphoesterase, partial [Streptomyces albiflaviniger]|nr:YmdB family metallophosphoesterase [Streptomyces albiflaviniger]
KLKIRVFCSLPSQHLRARGTGMRFLYLGDIVGRPGREAVLGLVPGLRERLAVDAVVANCENAAAGRGITPVLAEQLLAGGVDVLVGGNHIWHHREIGPFMDKEPRMVRPANHQNVPGRGWTKWTLADGRTLGVMQVEGRVFMRDRHAC